MHPVLKSLISGFSFSGNLREDVPAFLIFHACPKTAAHSRSVVEKARQLAARFELDAARAEAAAWLHDISAVFPNDKRLEISEQLGLEILPQEAQVPLLLHQKISAVMAEKIFGIHNTTGILDAIRCHTTLKSNPTTLEMLVFASDKLAWDQKGVPPYQAEMQAALATSAGSGGMGVSALSVAQRQSQGDPSLDAGVLSRVESQIRIRVK